MDTEDAAQNILWDVNQELVSLPKSLPEGWVKAAETNINPLLDIARKFSDGIARASKSGRYSEEGLADRQRELANEAGAALDEFEANTVKKVEQDILCTEEGMPPLETSLEEKIDPWSYVALLKHAREREIRDYLRTLDGVKITALYYAADADPLVISAIENAPSGLGFFPPEEIKKRQVERRKKQNPAAAMRMQQLEILKNFYTRTIGNARQKLGVVVKSEPQIFKPK